MAKGMLLDGFGFFFEFFFFFGGIHFLPVVGNFEYDRRQQKESDQIRDSHQGIQGIGDEPQAAQFDIRQGADRDQKHPDQPERFDGFDTEEVLRAFFTVKAPADQSREGEEHQTDGNDVLSELRERRFKGDCRHRGTVLAALPCSGHDDDEPGHGTDHYRIEKDAEHGNRSLTGRAVRS